MEAGVRAIVIASPEGSGIIGLEAPMWGDPIELQVYAEASCTYLAGCTGLRPRTGRRRAAREFHAGREEIRVWYSDTPGRQTVIPTWIAGAPFPPPAPVLGPDTLRPWLGDTVLALGAWAEATLPETRMLDDLLRQTAPLVHRRAAVLARHLGMDDLAASLAARDAEAMEAWIAMLFPRGGHRYANQSPHMRSWTTDRFRSFLATVPRHPAGHG